MVQVLALIPARGGSKGIPRKNLAPLLGKPLVVWSIEHAQNCADVNRVVVSTDDPEIADVARAAGAEVPFMRPAALAEDHVLDLPVFAHALNELNVKDGYQPDVVVHLRPTAPFRKSQWISQAIEALLHNPEADSIRSVSPPAEHPYRVFRLDARGYLEPIMKAEHPEPHLLRRQDHPPMHFYNCVLDVTRPRTIVEQRSMTGRNMLPFVMARADVLDIDTLADLELARRVLGDRL